MSDASDDVRDREEATSIAWYEHRNGLCYSGECRFCLVETNAEVEEPKRKWRKG